MNTMTVKQAAELLNVSEECIRIGLQRNIFQFGYAIPSSSGRRTNYVIFRPKFEEVTGIKVDG